VRDPRRRRGPVLTLPLDTWQADLQRRLDDALARHGVPGAAAGISLGDDEVVVAGGTANTTTGVDVTTDTLFQIGSITKLYTATLLMQAERAGLVNLDEPVRAVLHSLRLADDAATLEVTPRHLLTHTSGIEGDHVVDTGRGDDALERYVTTLAAVGQVHPPDELYSYCNAGYAIAGRVIEVLTGEHFDRALRRRLTGALGASATTVAERAILHRVAAGHVHRAGGTPTRQPRWTLFRANAPMGGLLAPAREVLAFARLHIDRGIAADGSELLPGETVAAMQEPHVAMYDVGCRRALGWTVWDWDDAVAIGHNGDTVGQKAFLRIVPEHRFAAVLLTNSPVGSAMAAELLPWIVGELLEVAVPQVPAADPDRGTPDVRAVLGSYERLHQHVEVHEAPSGLAMTLVPDAAMRALGATEVELPLDPIGPEQYRTTHPATGDAQVVTFLDPDTLGRTEYLHYGGRAHRRTT
jgi:CubicO group peptidase (beta-lactamase class C family)